MLNFKYNIINKSRENWILFRDAKKYYYRDHLGTLQPQSRYADLWSHIIQTWSTEIPGLKWYRTDNQSDKSISQCVDWFSIPRDGRRGSNQSCASSSGSKLKHTSWLLWKKWQSKSDTRQTSWLSGVRIQSSTCQTSWFKTIPLIIIVGTFWVIHEHHITRWPMHFISIRVKSHSRSLCRKYYFTKVVNFYFIQHSPSFCVLGSKVKRSKPKSSYLISSEDLFSWKLDHHN